MRHATDADHVVAVTTLVVRERSVRSGLLLGAFWGLGHCLTILLVGGAIIALKLAVPPGLERALEGAVGAMLAVLGLAALCGRRLPFLERDHVHPHEHLEGLPSRGRGAKAFVIGLVHGLAGSAGLSLLVLAAIPGTAAALAYLGVLSLGTLVGMALISAAMAWSLRRLEHAPAWSARLEAASGLASLVFGIYIIVKEVA